MNNLTSFMQQVKVIWQQRDPVTSVEYALIAVLIVGAVGVVGTSLSTFFTLTANCVTFAITDTGSCS